MPRKEMKFSCKVLVKFPDGTIKMKEDLTPEELNLFYEAASEKYAEICGPTIIREIIKMHPELSKSKK